MGNDAANKSDEQVPQKILQALLKDPKVAHGVPEQKRGQIVETVIAAYTSRFHCGPFPPPEMLAEYNNIIPNGADRIMKMAEQQMAHRIDIETKVITGQLSQSKLGQIFGLVIGIVGIGVGAVLAYFGKQVVGGIIAGSTVTGIVSVFVMGRNQQKQDLEKKSPVKTK